GERAVGAPRRAAARARRALVERRGVLHVPSGLRARARAPPVRRRRASARTVLAPPLQRALPGVPGERRARPATRPRLAPACRPRPTAALAKKTPRTAVRPAMWRSRDA